MMERPYQFLAERLQAALRASAATFTEQDLEDRWELLVEDGSEEVYVLSSEQLPAVAAALAEVGAGPDPRVVSRHAEARERLSRHDDCEDVLQGLAAQRDDVINALLAARTYCCDDTYEGKYGDRYLAIDGVLNALRPTVPGHGAYSTLDDSDYCEACQGTLGHEDDCWAETERIHFDTRRLHAIKSHLHCLGMGDSLIGQINMCLVRVEAVARKVRTHETYAEDDGMVVRHEDVISAFQLSDLNVTLDEHCPASIAAARYQPIE